MPKKFLVEAEIEFDGMGQRAGFFSVKSYYLALIGRQRSSFPWKAIWKSKTPSRMAFFAWEALLESILTVDNLRARNRIYVNRCYMCKGMKRALISCYCTAP